MVKATTFLFKLGVTGPEKDKMAANFIPTSVVSFWPPISFVHNDYDYNISSHWTFNTKYQIENTKNFDINIQEGKAVTGGKWRWESTPKIHSDIEFAMNEVSFMSSSYHHHMDPKLGPPIDQSILSLPCKKFGIIHSLPLLISIISGVLLHMGRRALH